MGPGLWAGGSLHLALTSSEGDDDSALVNVRGMGGIPEELEKHVVDRTSGRRRRSAVCQKRGRTARS